MNPDLVQPDERLQNEWLYPPNTSYYDEIMNPEGAVRSNWRKLIEPLAQMGGASFARRWQEGRRLIHENGTAYNVYSDPRNTDRPWPLDPIPLVLDRPEWEAIEAAITQRAQLLNAILADLY